MKKGIILLNMGGPNNLNEVEIFLRNMFNDKNIITIKSDFLRNILSFIISKTRKKSAIQNYKEIGSKSPIVENTKKLVQKLQILSKDAIVSYAMAYTPPFCDEAIKKIQNCNEVLIIPLYPHYSTTTIKSSLEDFKKHYENSGASFSYTHIREFYKNKDYNKLIAKLIKQTLSNSKAEEFDLIFSAHSLPQKIVKAGDPYENQIKEHVGILKEVLESTKLHFNRIHLAYQSKLGPVKWLEPELGFILENLKNKKTIIFPLSFCIDNSETDFELNIEYRKIADNLGFEDYRVCKCPNFEKDFVKILHNLSLLRREIKSIKNN